VEYFEPSSTPNDARGCSGSRVALAGICLGTDCATGGAGIEGSGAAGGAGINQPCRGERHHAEDRKFAYRCDHLLFRHRQRRRGQRSVSANNESFHATSSLTRNTLKYLTFKPVVTVLNVGTIYWFTGSVAATAATGTAAVLILPLTFYLNNMLWDWYDWHSVSADTAAQPAAEKVR
jgi:uncharacterized membrane protein